MPSSASSISSRPISALRNTQQHVSASLERLATGIRINRAADDPSGVQANAGLDLEVAHLSGLLSASERETYRLQATESAHTSLAELLTELDSLVVEASNTAGLGEGENTGLQVELDGVLDGIEHLLATSSFGGRRLFGDSRVESLGEIQVTPEHDQHHGTVVVGNADPGSATLADLRAGRALSLDSGDLEAAQTLIRSALKNSRAEIAGLGARQRYLLGSQNRANQLHLEALKSVRSEIADTD